MSTICNICTENLFYEQQDISGVSCGHTFHRPCLDQWWADNKTCPTCRRVCDAKIDKLYLDNFEEQIENLKLERSQLQTAVEGNKEDKEKIELCLGEIAILEVKNSILEEELGDIRAKCLNLEEVVRIRSEENNELITLAAEKTQLLRKTSEAQHQLLSKLGRVTEEKQNLEMELQKSMRTKAELEEELCCNQETISRLEDKIRSSTEENNYILLQTVKMMKILDETIQQNKDDLVSEIKLGFTTLQKDLGECCEKMSRFEEVFTSKEESRNKSTEVVKMMTKLNSSVKANTKNVKRNRTALQKYVGEHKKEISHLENTIQSPLDKNAIQKDEDAATKQLLLKVTNILWHIRTDGEQKLANAHKENKRLEYILTKSKLRNAALQMELSDWQRIAKQNDKWTNIPLKTDFLYIFVMSFVLFCVAYSLHLITPLYHF